MFFMILFFLILFMSNNYAYALDETTRYSGYRAYTVPEINKSTYGSTVSVMFDWVETTQAFDAKGNKTALFNDCGPVLLNELMPGPWVAPFDTLTEREKGGDLLHRVLQLSDDESRLIFSGKYQQAQAVFHVSQNIGSGIFVHIEIPVKRQVITDISWEPFLPRGDFKSVDGGLSSDAKYEGLKKLMNDEYQDPADANKKASFQRMLTEAGFADVKKEFTEVSLGDIGFYVGWAGEKSFEESIVKYAEGSLRIGFIGPVAKDSREDLVFSLPFGSEHHWAVSGRGTGELGLFSYCAVGGSLGSTIFFQRKYKVRLHDRVEANGWIRLDQEEVRVDRGSLWDFNAYAKAFYNPWGLSIWMGGSYASQGLGHFTEPVDAEKYTKEILQSDERNTGWKHIGLHCGASFDARKVTKKKILPLVRCTYDYSIAGEKIWQSHVLGGAFGFYFEWNW